MMPSAPKPARIFPHMLSRSNVTTSGPEGVLRSFLSQSTKRGAVGSPSTSFSLSPVSTVAFIIETFGWNEFGPSSQTYPRSSDRDVMLPPTRSRPSVTTSDVNASLCSVSSACAAHSPETPPPTITTSTDSLDAAWGLRRRSLDLPEEAPREA